MSTRVEKPFSDVAPKIDRIVQKLKTCDDFTSEAVHQYVLTIVNSYHGLTLKYRKEFSIYMTEAGFVEVFLPMWNSLHGCLDELENNISAEKLLSKVDSYGSLKTRLETFSRIVGIFTNFTDDCPDMGIALGDRGVIPLLFQQIQHAVSNHVKVSKSYFFSSVSRSNLMILHNSIRFSSHNRTLYRKCNAIEIMKECLNVTTELFQLDALMILAYVANDSESELLASSEKNIHVLTDILKCAASNDDHTYSNGHSIFNVFETLDAINHLAINDNNKRAISEDNIIPDLIKITKDESFKMEERRVAVELLWNLAFIDYIRASEEMKHAIPTLTDILNTVEDKDLKIACGSALMQIQCDNWNKVPHLTTKLSPAQPPSYQEAISEPNQASPTQNRIQIMVSYQWDSQPTAMQIRDKLRDAGYRVWMDITNMKGNILAGMGEAVEQSDVVLVCMTERYKDSQNCRSEAEYTYSLKKKRIPLLLEKGYKPDGWLGVFLGMQRYYEFYSVDDIHTNVGYLLDAIQNSLGLTSKEQVDAPVTTSKQEILESVPESDDEGDTESKEPLHKISRQIASSKPRPDDIQDWTKQDVKDWLRDKCVTDFSSCLDFCDGKHLEMLYTQYKENDREFKKELKSDYKMSGPQCLQFMVALKDLFKDKRVMSSPVIVSEAKTNATKSTACMII